MSKEREKLIKLLTDGGVRNFPFNASLADYLLANGVEALPLGTLDALFGAVDALADMVYQFGYSTKFRNQDAVCDGGLSALENAFGALYDCGYRLNSNGTINRKNLVNYNIKQELANIEKLQKEIFKNV